MEHLVSSWVAKDGLETYFQGWKPEKTPQAVVCLVHKPPLLLFHGTKDNITLPSGSQEFASLVPGDCTLKLWDGLHHETHNEPEKEQVLAFLSSWLNSKLQLDQAGI